MSLFRRYGIPSYHLFEGFRREIAVNRSPQHERLTTLIASVDTLPQPGRFTVLGAASGGMVGAIIGLIVGLYAFPPTALFAMVELGLPATIAGGIVGFVIGSILETVRRISRSWQRVQRPHQSGRSRI